MSHEKKNKFFEISFLRGRRKENEDEQGKMGPRAFDHYADDVCVTGCLSIEGEQPGAARGRLNSRKVSKIVLPKDIRDIRLNE